jgi:hypothetical protein
LRDDKCRKDGGAAGSEIYIDSSSVDERGEKAGERDGQWESEIQIGGERVMRILGLIEATCTST